MSTVELIYLYYKAFNSKNYEEMLSCLSEDVIHQINQGGTTVGKDSFKEFMIKMDRFYDENLVDIIIMTEPSGYRAAAEFTCNGIYKETAPGLPEAKGQKYSLPVGCFFEVRNNLIRRVTNYYNMNDWVLQVK